MKFLYYILVLSLLLIIGCTGLCDRGHPDLCDKSCRTNSDCMQACPIGCINNNEKYDIPTDLLCERMDCKCIEDICTTVEPSFE